MLAFSILIQVTATFAQQHTHTLNITIDGETIHTTDEHPFLNADGAWVNAQDLQVGNEIVSADGDVGVVEAIERIDEPQMMYNLSVAVVATYLVGDGRWVVHNVDITFYHGTTYEGAISIQSDGIDLNRGRLNADFGKGFYVSTQLDTALWSATRFDPSPQVVTFVVPEQQFATLSGLEFVDADASWADFARYHKEIRPKGLMHGGNLYDYVTGAMFKRRSNSKNAVLPFTFPNTDVLRMQTSIHTQKAVDLFNSCMRR